VKQRSWVAVTTHHRFQATDSLDSVDVAACHLTRPYMEVVLEERLAGFIESIEKRLTHLRPGIRGQYEFRGSPCVLVGKPLRPQSHALLLPRRITGKMGIMERTKQVAISSVVILCAGWCACGAPQAYEIPTSFPLKAGDSYRVVGEGSSETLSSSDPSTLNVVSEYTVDANVTVRKVDGIGRPTAIECTVSTARAVINGESLTLTEPLYCGYCGGHLMVVSTVHDPTAVQAIIAAVHAADTRAERQRARASQAAPRGPPSHSRRPAA
jgi:hypothetical protein